jgi:hypothetical protein
VDGCINLFGNSVSDGPSVLFLWHSDNLFGKFERNPASPVRASGRGSRMAGAIAHWNGQLYRLGQDWKQGYGDGIIAFRIEKIDPTAYVEVEAGEAAFEKVRGPHAELPRKSFAVRLLHRTFLAICGNSASIGQA